MIKKKSIIIIGILLLIVPIVSSYRLLCLGYGDVYPGPSGKVCYHDLCQVCVNDEMTYHVNYNYCNDITACEIFNTSKIDADPPNLAINSPEEGGVYESTSILFDVKSDEPCSLYYMENNGRGRWTRVCASCREYSNKRRFNEGFNNLTIKCIDRSGNNAQLQRTFRVDSKNPKISRTGPTSGFASGIFEVKFKEDNPKELWLIFGNPGRFSSKKVDLNDCEKDERYTTCEVHANLSNYDGEYIIYWFNITDIADNYDESRIRELKVDFSPPVIRYVEIEKDKRRVYFMINVSEINFEELIYMEDGRERRICNRLNEGICEGKASFREGWHNVTLIAKDEAENEANWSTYFFIDSKNPRILKSEPRNGFTNGFFEVQFKEENPVSLILKYGNITNEKSQEVNLGECDEYRMKKNCSINVDLSEFHSQKITYHFEIEDIVGNKDESRKNELEVDTAAPKLNNNGSFWSRGTGRYEDYIYFSLNITEENFKAAEYKDGQERWKTLCSRLDNGLCEARKSFESGTHVLDMVIKDRAGNSVSERIEFNI